MASDSRNMPGLFSPSPSHPPLTSQRSYFDPAQRFFTTETSGYQVTDANGHETRKRSRPDSISRGSTTHFWDESSLQYSRNLDAKSPPPLANDRYQLAGGDMYGAVRFARQDGNYDDYDRLQQQRGQWSIPPTPATGVRQYAPDKMEVTPNGTKSWSLLGLVGGVAGKLFQFCTVPFRGFQAGGGQTYVVKGQDEIAARLGLADDPFLHQSAGPVRQAPPGFFPQDDYGVQSIDSLDQDSNGRPPAKRLRTADNWVVVDENGEEESRPETPRLSGRRVPDYTRSPSQIPRPASRTSTTPSLKRPSLIPVSRRSSDRRSFHTTSKATPSHSRQRSYNRLSYGSPAMLDEKPKKPSSPLPKESQRLINRVRREEMADDARMRRMSSQMSAMLREAKEALGAKYEVEEFDDDDDGIDLVGEPVGAQSSAYFPRFS